MHVQSWHIFLHVSYAIILLTILIIPFNVKVNLYVKPYTKDLILTVPKQPNVTDGIYGKTRLTHHLAINVFRVYINSNIFCFPTVIFNRSILNLEPGP